MIAGGGGGVPLTAAEVPVGAVVDKDRVASLLAIGLGAEALVFATNVDHVYEDHGTPKARPLPALTLAEGQRLIDRGEVAQGSMLPKLESAMRFVRATGRPARICGIETLDAALTGAPGTSVRT